MLRLKFVSCRRRKECVRLHALNTLNDPLLLLPPSHLTMQNAETLMTIIESHTRLSENDFEILTLSSFFNSVLNRPLPPL